MTTQEIVDQRLYNQHITQSRCGSVAEVVAALGAMQAQDYPGALWSIGLRLPGSTKSDVEQAIARREIVRTWPMRGTLHFVPASDTRWMLELMTPRIIRGTAARVRNLELDDEIFARSERLIVKALEGDKQLTRSALCQLLDDNGVATQGQRGIHILSRLSQQGILCFAAHEGKQPTFALLHEWVPTAKSLPKDESLAILTERYFTSHGPATMQDFRWWSGLLAKDAITGLESVKHKFISETVNGKQYYMRPSTAANSSKIELHLLPGFDEYILGYTDRSAALPSLHSNKIVPGNNGMFISTIVLNGHIAGLWRKKVGTKTITIAAEPFEKLTTSELRLFEKAAQQYGTYTGQRIHVKDVNPS